MAAVATWEHSESLQHLKVDAAFLLKLRRSVSDAAFSTWVHIALTASGNAQGARLYRTTLASREERCCKTIARHVAELEASAPRGTFSVHRNRKRVWTGSAWKKGPDTFRVGYDKGAGRIWLSCLTHPAFTGAPPSARSFFLLLWSQTGSGRTVQLSMAQLRRAMGDMSEATIRDAVTYWRAWGWLAVYRDADLPFAPPSYRLSKLEEMRNAWEGGAHPTARAIRAQRSVVKSAGMLCLRLLHLAGEGARILTRIGDAILGEGDEGVFDVVRDVLARPYAGVPYRGPTSPRHVRAVAAVAHRERERFERRYEDLSEDELLAELGPAPPPPAPAPAVEIAAPVPSAEWDGVLGMLARSLGGVNFDVWLSVVKHAGFAEGELLLTVPAPHYIAWIEREYLDVITNLSRQFFPGPTSVRLVLEGPES